MDKRTIIDYLVREGVTSDDIIDIMQVRCKQKKKIGAATGSGSLHFSLSVHFHRFVVAEKKTDETTKEKKMNGTMDEQSNSSILSGDGKEPGESVKEEVSPKRNAKRTAKGKAIKYGGSDDEDDDDNDDDQENTNGDYSDYMGSDSDEEKKVKKAKTKAKEQVELSSLDWHVHRSVSLLFSHRKRKMLWASWCKIDKPKTKHRRKPKPRNPRNLEFV